MYTKWPSVSQSVLFNLPFLSILIITGADGQRRTWNLTNNTSLWGVSVSSWLPLMTWRSLWSSTQCKTSCRYPHPAGPVIHSPNPVTDCFRRARRQRQLAAATDSWFVLDFTVQERPTRLSTRGITERDKWHHVCIWEQLWPTLTPQHNIHAAGPLRHNASSLKIKREQLKAIRLHCSSLWVEWTAVYR